MKALMLGLALFVGGQSAPTVRSGELTPADRALIVSRIPRVPIDRFGALPPTVREAFTRLNCHVPQTTQASSPANLITGELAVRGQQDWAALCSDGTLTEIRIVWGGPEQCEDRLAARQDTDTLVATGPGVFVYSRGIRLSTSEQFQRLISRYNIPLPAAPDHEGIEDRIEQAGVAHYCSGGHWRTIP